MALSKSHIIAQLQKDILPLQGFKKAPGSAVDVGWGIIDDSFPNRSFPTGAIHEFINDGPASAAATNGFITGIISALMKTDGCCIWISTSRTLFPPALKQFGIEPDKIIFIDLQKDRDVMWVLEESLKCNGLAAVICELCDISFTASRRLQLAVEQSRVTGFIIRHNPRNLITNACLTRWKITSLPGVLENNMPGIGFPRWNVELLKVRNGKPGSWQIEWAADHFRHDTPKITSIPQEQKKIAG
jgi:protein ImuA